MYVCIYVYIYIYIYIYRERERYSYKGVVVLAATLRGWQNIWLETSSRSLGSKKPITGLNLLAYA